MLLILFAFIAGIVTVLSPCILPLLPIILSSSQTHGGKRRPVGIVLGFIASFTFFTLFLSSIVRLTGIPSTLFRNVSIIILLIFGISMVVEAFQTKVERLFQVFISKTPNTSQQTGFFGGIVIGLSLGLLWTPCVGPILASIISLALSGTVTAHSIVITLAYATGTAIPMFGIILAGSTALERISFLKRNTITIRKGFGIIMILVAIAIFFNVDRKIQTLFINAFPSYGTNLTKIEDVSLIRKELENMGTQSNTNIIGKPMDQPMGIPAPEFIPTGSWFNSDPFSLTDLRGKVVLVDFWTYSCINCRRTLPYLQKWWEKYKDRGFVLVGVHSPEFEFEKDRANVQGAINEFGLTYPIFQDNDFKTWRSYSNRYWPAKYLVDKNGFIRYTHFGEGKYDETEAFIQNLLEEAGAEADMENISNSTYSIEAKTPETYLGSNRIERFASKENIIPEKPTTYTLPEFLDKHNFAFGGVWSVFPEYALAGKEARIHINFDAKQVFLVARPRNEKAIMRVYVDGEIQYAGADVENGEVIVTKDELYELVHLETPGQHILSIEFPDGEIEVYAFTFG